MSASPILARLFADLAEQFVPDEQRAPTSEPTPCSTRKPAPEATPVPWAFVRHEGVEL